MYESYWGLQRPVFGGSAGREALAQSPVHAEALARLEFLKDGRLPLGLLIGPAGSGKSTVLAEFAQQARRSGALAAIVPCSGDETFVLARIATGLYAEAVGDSIRLWRQVVDRMEELKLEGMSAVLLFDDLDRASAAIVAHVERLLSIPDAPLTVVVSAREGTAGRLGSGLLDQTALRIDLAPWTEGETCAYLDTSVAKAGRAQPAFDHEAVRRLFELSGGAPRRVNQLAQLALVAGAAQKLARVDAATVEAVEEELSLAR
jgi:type II secretory pathway predicted ATPase ExeA